MMINFSTNAVFRALGIPEPPEDCHNGQYFQCDIQLYSAQWHLDISPLGVVDCSRNGNRTDDRLVLGSGITVGQGTSGSGSIPGFV